MTSKYIISPVSSSVASLVLKIQHLGFLAFYPTGHIIASVTKLSLVQELKGISL